MAILFPLMDGFLGAFLVLGSPSLGYVLLRTAWPRSQAWSGFSRGVGASILGMSWTAMLAYVLVPGLSQRIPVQGSSLAEFAWVAGMGLILLTFITSMLSRFVWYRYIQPWNPAMSTPVPASSRASEEKKYSNPTIPVTKPITLRPTHELEAPVLSDASSVESMPPSPRVYKPSQLKLPVKPAREPPETVKPAPSSDDDVLDLLRSEEGSPSPLRAKSATPSVRTTPMTEMTDFAGFDETLAQLRRDLKAFNESVDTHGRKNKEKPAPGFRS